MLKLLKRGELSKRSIRYDAQTLIRYDAQSLIILDMPTTFIYILFITIISSMLEYLNLNSQILSNPNQISILTNRPNLLLTLPKCNPPNNP